MKRHRDTQVELLRIVLMFLIVFWHCSMCRSDGDMRVSKLMACLPVFSVDAFILISGYYGISFSVKKVGYLLWLGLFSAVAVSLSGLCVVSEFAFRYSLGWFGLGYLALMVLSPLINSGLQSVVASGRGLHFWLSFTVLIIMSWLPTGGGIDMHIPGFGGMTVVTMLYVYVTGRIIYYFQISRRIRTCLLVMLFIILCLLNISFAVFSGLTWDKGAINLLFSKWRFNDSPLVVAMAILFFLIFLRLRLSPIIERWIVLFAPSMFSIYLLHCGTNFSISRTLIGRYLFLPFNTAGMYAVATLFAAAFTFILCLLMDLLRRWCESTLNHWLSKGVDK